MGTKIFGWQDSAIYEVPTAARLAIEADFKAAGGDVNGVRLWIVVDGYKLGTPADNTDTCLANAKTARAEGKTIHAVVTPIQCGSMTQVAWKSRALPASQTTVTDYMKSLCEKFSDASGPLIDFAELGANEPQFGSVYWPGSPQLLWDTFASEAAVFHSQKPGRVLTPSWNGTNFTEMLALIGPMVKEAGGIALHPYSVKPSDIIKSVQAKWPGYPIDVTEFGDHQLSLGYDAWAASLKVGFADAVACGVRSMYSYPTTLDDPTGPNESQAAIMYRNGTERDPFYSAQKAAVADWFKAKSI